MISEPTIFSFKLVSREKTSQVRDEKKISLSLIINDQGLPNKYKEYSKLTLLPKILGEWSAEAEERCTICWKKIEANSEISSCPYCKRNFHRSHWVEWIRSRQFCPACRRKILINSY